MIISFYDGIYDQLPVHTWMSFTPQVHNDLIAPGEEWWNDNTKMARFVVRVFFLIGWGNH
jgi:hypothetical protein